MKTFFMTIMALVLATAVQAQNGYQIRSGDVLSVEVLQDPSLNREVLVLPDGSISFPFAGNIPAAGNTIAGVQSRIAAGIAPNFAEGVEPNVFVTVRQLTDRPVSSGVSSVARTIDVYFLGEVGAPGLVEVSPGTTLLQALSLSGGFTNFAAQRRIQLRRTNAHTGEISVAVIDYRAISDGGVLSSDPVLADGDVILVPERRLFE